MNAPVNEKRLGPLQKHTSVLRQAGIRLASEAGRQFQLGTGLGLSGPYIFLKNQFGSTHRSRTRRGKRCVTLTTASSVALTTIFFDAGGTIVYPEPGLTLAALAERNYHPLPEQLHAAERNAKRELDEARARHDSVDAQYWDIYYLHLFRELGIDDDAELRSALVTATRTGMNWRRVLPDARQALERLKDGHRLGLISNSDGSVRRLFETLSLDSYFDSFTDSQHCGYEKPDPRIFQAALAAMGAMPEESLYVGDIYSIDYVGAQGAGMGAVLVDVAGAYRGMGYARVGSLTELHTRLGEFSHSAT
jgi:HAD superfamily hydrolase (TIGR01509 family)